MLLKNFGTNDQGCKFPADELVSVAVVRKRTKWRLFVAYSRVAGKLDVSNGAPPTSVVPRIRTITGPGFFRVKAQTAW